MTESICSKCGAKIPAKARFCQNCGAEKEAATPPAPQPQQPTPPPVQPVQPSPPPAQPMSSPTQSSGSLNSLFSKNLIIIGTLLGLLLAWIGRIITAFNLTFTPANGAGQVVNSLGFLAIGVFLIGGGIVNKHIDKYIRLGMIIGGAIAAGMGI